MLFVKKENPMFTNEIKDGREATYKPSYNINIKTLFIIITGVKGDNL